MFLLEAESQLTLCGREFLQLSSEIYKKAKNNYHNRVNKLELLNFDFWFETIKFSTINHLFESDFKLYYQNKKFQFYQEQITKLKYYECNLYNINMILFVN